MAYQPIEKPIPEYFEGKKVFGKKRDCKDFKPYFFNREHCKLEANCRVNGYHCEGLSGMLAHPRVKKLCTGISIDRWENIMSKGRKQNG